MNGSAAPPVIVGGGPAGAAAAIALARAGVRPIVLERLLEPGDAICGGFLSWATLRRVEALGVVPDRLGGHPVTEAALFVRDKPYLLKLPAKALGVSRRRLDGVLLEQAEREGVDVRRGVGVHSVNQKTLALASGEVMEWHCLFLATGKHDLRGTARPRDAIEDDPELGLRLRLPPDAGLQALLAGRIELHLFDRGYLGLVLHEDGSANACMAVRKSRLGDAGGDPASLFRQLANASPPLADRLATMPLGARIDAIGNVPYGWRARATRPGLFRLGDQAAVIPSLAGEGMGIALASAQSAVTHWRSKEADGALLHQREFARKVGRPMIVAGLAKRIGGMPPLAAALASLPGAARLIARLTRLPDEESSRK